MGVSSQRLGVAMARLKAIKSAIQRAPSPLAGVRYAGVSDSRRMRGRAWMSLREQVFKRDSMTCQSCGRITDEPQCDHITPLWAGGADVMSNLQTLCIACHDQKTAAEAAARVKKQLKNS